MYYIGTSAQKPRDQPTKNNITMVELFAGSSGMAIVNQLTPPPGAYAEGTDQRQCCRFYVIVPTGQKKIN
jgi:hypothetical protein